MMVDSWTDEEKKRAFLLINLGNSYAQVATLLAKEFGTKRTRSSISGMIMRGRDAASPGRKRASYAPRVAEQKEQVDAAPEPIHREVKESVPGVAFTKTKLWHCRWPISGSGVDMRCCGERREGASSYCAAHRKQSVSPYAFGRSDLKFTDRSVIRKSVEDAEPEPVDGAAA